MSLMTGAGEETTGLYCVRGAAYRSGLTAVVKKKKKKRSVKQVAEVRLHLKGKALWIYNRPCATSGLCASIYPLN